MSHTIKRLAIIPLCLAIFLLGFIKSSLAQNKNDDVVNISLKNNTLLPKKITVVSYTPGEIGNGTTSAIILPGLAKKYKFKEGTRIYLADSEQVEIVMSGKRIDSARPFLTVKKEDNEKQFKIDQ